MRQARNHRTITDENTDAATAALTMTTHRLHTPFRDMAARFAAVLADIDALAASGHNESECRMFEQAIGAKIDARFGGRACTDDRTARRMELEADTQEDKAEGLLAIEGETAVGLDLHAQALDKQAVASRTMARIQRAKARVIRELRGAARRQLGLSGAV